MQIIKNINNNFAVAVDKKGNTLVIRGKGVGFGQVPREADKKLIERSYYDVDENYISMINEIPDDIIQISTRIIDQARMTLENPINSNIVFTLADHINFSIERYRKNMNIKLPIVYDVQHLYEKEYKLGLYGIELVKKELSEYLPKEEASYIALHLINAEEQIRNKTLDEDKFVEEITEIIESEYDIRINKENFNYSRFASHMYYLFKRSKDKIKVSSDNEALYEKLKKDYQKTNECTEKVADYLKEKLKTELSDEEKLYLMLHINRLCTREDCDQ